MQVPRDYGADETLNSSCVHCINVSWRHICLCSQ